MAPATQAATLKTPLKFTLDFTQPAEEGVFDGASFQKFLYDRVKVEGRTGKLGDKIKIEKEGANKLAITSSIPLSKRYLKYLTKKYLKKTETRGVFRVVSVNKTTYAITPLFNFNEESDDDE